MSQIAYLSPYGHMGNNTKESTVKIIPHIIHLLDSVVSNLNDAYFLYPSSEATGSNISGYLPLR